MFLPLLDILILPFVQMIKNNCLKNQLIIMGKIISNLYILFTGFPGTTVENGNKYTTNQSVRCPD